MANNSGVSGGGKEKKKIGINFISPLVDQLTQVLQWTLTYGLVLTAIVVAAMIGLSGYEYNLETQLQKINNEIAAKARQLDGTQEFENEFLATQEKLIQYAKNNTDEKMADLFPKLSALVPDGVQLKDLIIQPDSVEIVSYAVDQGAIAQFANNLKLANNSAFEDGQKLMIHNSTVRDISKSTEQMMNISVDGYMFSVSFNYSIE